MKTFERVDNASIGGQKSNEEENRRRIKERKEKEQLID